MIRLYYSGEYEHSFTLNGLVVRTRCECCCVISIILSAHAFQVIGPLKISMQKCECFHIAVESLKPPHSHFLVFILKKKSPKNQFCSMLLGVSPNGLESINAFIWKCLTMHLLSSAMLKRALEWSPSFSLGPGLSSA